MIIIPSPTATSAAAIAIENRFTAQIAVPEELPGVDALATMNERSVCRKYQDRPLDDELVRLLCATATIARLLRGFVRS